MTGSLKEHRTLILWAVPQAGFDQYCYMSNIRSCLLDRNDAVLFSEHFIKRHMMSICPATGDVSLHHLVILVSARFFPCDAIVLSYAVVRVCRGDSANALFLISPLPPSLS